MTKIVLSLLFTFTTLSAFASPEYIGSWCHRYDDFTEVLVIDSNSQARSFSIGNQAGEIVQPQSGYVSMGASQFQIVMNGSDIGVIDFNVSRALFSKKRILTFKMQDGEKQRFSECTVKFR
jgi:hypothetical protein